MEINSKVLRNALAKNAGTFKVGDKVVYGGADPKAYKRDGIIKYIEEKNGKPQLTVRLDNGETFTAPTDDWARWFANSVAKNAIDKKQKRFDNVTAFAFPGKYTYAGITVDIADNHISFDGTKKESIAKAMAGLAEFKKAVNGIKNAIAWMETIN